MRSVLTALAVLAAGCGGSEAPRYSLRMVMLEMELRRADIEGALLRDGGLAEIEEEVAKIRGWLADPAKEAYFDSGNARGTRAQFDAFEEGFRPRLDALSAAAASGDLAATTTAFRALEDGCNACHAVFRPDLAQR